MNADHDLEPTTRLAAHMESESTESDLGLLLTLAEVATLLSVPESWLRKRVASHTVPCTRLGRHIRFTRQQVDQIVLAAHQPTLPTPTFGLTRRSRRVG